jgi:hypothetical protein
VISAVEISRIQQLINKRRAVTVKEIDDANNAFLVLALRQKRREQLIYSPFGGRVRKQPRPFEFLAKSGDVVPNSFLTATDAFGECRIFIDNVIA